MPSAYQGTPPPATRSSAALLVAALEGGVDHVLEAVEGAGHGSLAVHEEGGRAGHVGGLPVGHVLLDLLLDLGRVVVLLPARDVEPDLPRVLLQLVEAELTVVLEQGVVHLPELALPTGCRGGLGL